MLKGIDISHWNSKASFAEPNIDFAIIKASEGKTFIDNAVYKHYQQSVDRNLITGFYHYARAEKNSPSEEAKHFLDVIPTKKDIIMALDIEGKSLENEYINDWACCWLQYVEKKTGIKPLLYCSQAEIKRFTAVAKNNYGLWVARYNKIIGDIKPWNFWAIWQYNSDNGLDKNIFNGSKEQLIKYTKAR